ncbi:hypothetical protein FTV88_2182 [Heliorestis convoluta]|uniref:Uncharacterized protein n=1 Tax=Heliorestis convoluta TaxID=356322 RepID=A0A5Q2N7N7_9FIRM|nr:hypothetical protein FTV88_2182 [Heliorestis convoluta]
MHDIFPLLTVILVYFVYGLSFFSMGLIIFALRLRFSRLTLAGPMVWLGLFGLVHGTANPFGRTRANFPEPSRWCDSKSLWNWSGIGEYSLSSKRKK